jgi:hypothetical protein
VWQDRGVRVAWAVGLLAGCGGRGATEAPAPARAEHPLGPAFVVVADETWFHPAADASAPRARAAVRAGCGGRGEPTTWVMRRVEKVGDWLAVENLQPPEAAAHCADHPEALDGWRLRLYVRVADLQLVTTREVKIDFADGTGFTVSAGVPVTPVADRFSVDVDGHAVALPIPAAAVGTDYAAATPHLLADDATDEDDLGVPGATYLGGDLVALRASAVEHAGEIYALTNRCDQFRVRIPDASSGGTGWGTIGCGRPGELGEPGLPRVVAGARLRWPDGTDAGEALVEQTIRWPAAAAAGASRCFRLPLRERVDWPDREHPQDEWFLTLCADERDWRDASY